MQSRLELKNKNCDIKDEMEIQTIYDTALFCRQFH